MTPPSDARRLERLRGLAHLLDTAVTIPGTSIRVGLDALVGLIPGVGDLAGAAVSGWIVLESARLGAGTATLARMLGNVLVETVVGAVPVLGDLFDVAWRANARNVALLERQLDAPADEPHDAPRARPSAGASAPAAQGPAESPAGRRARRRLVLAVAAVLLVLLVAAGLLVALILRLLAAAFA